MPQASAADHDTPRVAWWEQFAGIFAGDAAAFDSAMRLGRVYRQSLRPQRASKGKRPRPSAPTS
jgi:hypothetical protein